MSYSIVKVGVPIRTQDITPEFLNAVQSVLSRSDTVAVATSGYPQASTVEGWLDKPRSEAANSPAGHRVLFDQLKFKPWDGHIDLHVVNCLTHIWAGHDRNFKLVARELIDTLDSEYLRMNFSQVLIFAGGSPNFGDSFTTELIRNGLDVTVIDCPSSYSIAVDAIKELIGPLEDTPVNYVHEFLRLGNKTLNPDQLNIFSSVQGGYEIDGRSVMSCLFDDLSLFYSDTARLYAVHIGEQSVQIEQSTLGQAKTRVDYYEQHPNSLILGITR